MSVFNSIDNYLVEKSSGFKFTNVIGLARTLLAMGTLLTLVFNPVSNFLYVLNDGSPASPILLEDGLKNKLNFFLLFGFEAIWLMKIFAIAILLSVVSGYFTKITSVLHWWVAWSFMMFSSAIDGGDQIANNLSFLFIPICFFDNRRNHWDAPRANNAVNNFSGFFFLQLIRLQVALIYLHASVGKLPVTEWADGTAVYYWFNNAAFGLPNFLHYLLDPLLSNNYVVILLTYGTIAFELFLFLCLTMPLRHRKHVLVFALLFHAAIIVFHGIFSFFFSMASALVLYLSDYNRMLKFKRFYHLKPLIGFRTLKRQAKHVEA